MLVHRPCEPGQRIDEDGPLEPIWDCPQSKVQTEELIRAQHRDIPCVLLRIAGVYDEMCHSIPLAHQMQRIFERTLTSSVYPGDTARGQSFLHRDDLVDAIDLLVQRRARLPNELPLLLGEPETLSYAELQHAFGQLIHGEDWSTTEIPKAVAKTGAWLQRRLPGVDDPFIRPWMIDLADDHYALDIRRARVTRLGAEAFASRHVAQDDGRTQSGSAGLVRGEQPQASVRIEGAVGRADRGSVPCTLTT